jgi:hypothetical protein
MNKDCKLIFEAYLVKKPVISEAPIYGMGDIGYSGDFESAPGKGYGIGKVAAKEGKPMADVANRLLAAIKTKLFKPAKHVVDGKEYDLYYPGSKMKFRTELENLIKTELKLGGTEAKYTARIVDNLLNVVRVDAEGGTAASPHQVKQAVDAGVKGKAVIAPGTPGTSPAQPEAPKANSFVKNPNARFIKEWMPIFVELPDEITIEKGDIYDSPELKNEVIEAITRAYDQKMANDKEVVQDFIDSLKFKSSYTPASEKKEGEGTGEVETVEEYPEDDLPTSELRGMGALPGRRGYDSGGFSYGD